MVLIVTYYLFTFRFFGGVAFSKYHGLDFDITLELLLVYVRIQTIDQIKYYTPFCAVFLAVVYQTAATV